MSGLLEDLKVPTPPYRVVNPGGSSRHLGRCLGSQGQMKLTCRSRAALQKRAQETHRILLELGNHGKLQIASAKAA